MKGKDITVNEWIVKEQLILEDFIWGVGPEALYRITRAKYKTEADIIKIKDLIRLFTEYYLPKRNTNHRRGNFSGQIKRRKKHPKTFGEG